MLLEWRIQVIGSMKSLGLILWEPSISDLQPSGQRVPLVIYTYNWKTITYTLLYFCISALVLLHVSLPALQVKALGCDGSTSLVSWLDGLGLHEYLPNFLSSGYRTLECVKNLWELEIVNVRNPDLHHLIQYIFYSGLFQMMGEHVTAQCLMFWQRPMNANGLQCLLVQFSQTGLHVDCVGG